MPSEEKDESNFLALEPNGRSSGFKIAGASSNHVMVQQEDAERRTVAWSAEEHRNESLDADGEDDPEYINDSGVGFDVPLGIRKAGGAIEPLNVELEEPMEVDGAEVKYFGKPESIPSHVGQLV